MGSTKKQLDNTRITLNPASEVFFRPGKRLKDLRECLLNCENLHGGMGGLTEPKMKSLMKVMWKERVLRLGAIGKGDLKL